MAEVLLTRRAVQDLKRLDPPVRERILQTLQQHSAEPLRQARKFTNPRIGTYRYRIGSYRVVFDLDDDSVVVLRIGHRKEIYS